MFSENEWSAIEPWAIARLRSDLERHGNGRRIADAVEKAPGQVSRWKADSSRPQTPSRGSLQKLIERYWQMSRGEVLEAAGLAHPPGQPPREPERRAVGRWGEPPQLTEAIRLRIDGWSGRTVDRLREIAAQSGLRRSVGSWIDCGDELEALEESRETATETPTPTTGVTRIRHRG